MPEETTTEPAKGEEGKTFTQTDVDRIVADRLKREQAKHSDYDEFKAKAQKLDELEAASKSDLDKANARAEAAEKARDEAVAKLLRHEVAAEKGVKPRWLSGSTREELEAAADEYLTDHPPAKGAEPPPGKPAEDLRGGGDPTQEPEPDIRKVVEAIPRGF